MGLIDTIQGWFNRPEQTTPAEVVNTDLRITKRSNLIKQITERQVFRKDNDIRTWKRAVDWAQNIQRPRRQQLIDIYHSVADDAHLSSIMDNRIQQVLSADFNIVSPDGTRNADLEAILHQEWFDKFIRLCIESKYYGYSLIQFLPNEIDKECFKLDLVNRRNVVPEQHKVLRDQNKDEYIQYDQPRFEKWVIGIGEDKDLGLLNKACPLVLIKRNTYQAHGSYADKFGMPTALLKTDVTETSSKNEMVNFLKNMGQSAYAIIGTEDELEFANTDHRDVSEVYQSLIEFINGELSKLILGATMGVDNGSSRAQAEVHERTQSMQTKSDLRWLEHIVNNKLIPFLELHGYQFGDAKFVWADGKRSATEQIKIDAILLQYHKLDKDYLQERYNVVIDGDRDEGNETNPEDINEIGGGNEDDPR